LTKIEKELKKVKKLALESGTELADLDMKNKKIENEKNKVKEEGSSSSTRNAAKEEVDVEELSKAVKALKNRDLGKKVEKQLKRLKDLLENS